MGLSYDDFPRTDPIRDMLAGHAMPQEALVLICHGFSDSQYDQFRRITPEEYGVLRYGDDADCHLATIVVQVRMVTGLADLRGIDPDQPSLALVDPECVPPNAVYAAGYVDFLSYPFIGTEVARRLAVVRGELAHRASQAMRVESRQEQMLEQACSLLAAGSDFSGGIEALARRLATNRNTLHKAFKERFGVGPMTWQRQERLNRAAELLVRTDRSVLDVALSVGYENPANFSTAFKRQHHLGPRAFKQHARKAGHIHGLPRAKLSVTPGKERDPRIAHDAQVITQ